MNTQSTKYKKVCEIFISNTLAMLKKVCELALEGPKIFGNSYVFENFSEFQGASKIF